MKLPPYILIALICSSKALANDPESLNSLDLESLMATDVQATSAMKRAQSAFTTAASLYVLSKEDIQASSALNVAEALKLVPGLEVRQLDNNQWAISSRSVAGRYTSKLLVMVDGQSVYNPTFAGVYWEALNVPLYDIERIEVIRGQGGLLWGSNATNGVINIITQNSLDTRSTLVQASSGDQINYDLALRHGGNIGSNGSYRVYGNLHDSDAAKHAYLGEPHDDSQQQSLGLRLDFAPNDDLSILAQASYTHTDNGQNLKLPDPSTHINSPVDDSFKRDDGRIMLRLDHRLSHLSNQMLQASWAIQDGEQLFLDERFQSIDIDYQMNTLLGRTQIDWGLNYRHNSLPFEENPYVSSDHNITQLEQYGAFLQAQFALIPNQLNLILGDKSEHNSLTGWEHQPVARLLWQPTAQHVVWGAVSQGARIPSLAEFDYNIALHGEKVGDYIDTGSDELNQYHVRTTLNGNDQVEPEKSLSYELGYRLALASWSFDLALFHTQSSHVFTISPDFSAFDEAYQLLAEGRILEAQQALMAAEAVYNVVSNADLKSTGGEALLTWRPNQRFSGELGYHQIAYRYQLQENTLPAIGYDSDTHQWFTKLSAQVFQQHSLFVLFRNIDSDAYMVDNFNSLDLTWNWHLQPQTKLAFSAKNILADSHLEYRNTSETFTIPNYIEPSVMLQITADF